MGYYKQGAFLSLFPMVPVATQGPMQCQATDYQQWAQPPLLQRPQAKAFQPPSLHQRASPSDQGLAPMYGPHRLLFL